MSDLKTHFDNCNVSAVAIPHSQLKNRTTTGVKSPRSRPAILWLLSKGKTTNNWKAVGNKLRIVPFRNKLDCDNGRKNSKPQIPPHTTRE